MNKSLSVLTAFVFFSLCTSKAGLNISLILLSTLVIFYSTKRDNHGFLNVIRAKPIALTLITFIIGLFSSYVSNFDFRELGMYLSKGMLFFSLPALIIILNKKKMLNIAFYSYLSGLVIAIIYAIYHWYKLCGFNITSLETTRIDSFWDVGRWAEALVYSLCLLIPHISESKEKIPTKFVLTVICIASFVCMILSGGRAAIVALAITASLYFIFRRPLFMAGAISLLFFTVMAFPSSPFVKPVTERIASITNTENQYSNIARLTMWKNGLEILEEKLSGKPVQLLFGSGPKHYQVDLENHLRSKGELETVATKTEHQFSMTDSHNTYLDLANKMGIIYLFAYLMTLGAFILFFTKYLKSYPLWAYSGIGLVLSHLIFGFFYTSGLQFQTIVLFYLLGLCYSHIKLVTKENLTHA